jgi:hypothetical protein
MTSPEDDGGLEEALRRALSEAASEVEPGSDGLDKIRSHIGGRPPRPWLFSVLSGAADRVRNWTWRGHWAWPGWLSRLTEARWPQLRRGSFPGSRNWSLRLAAVFAAAAVVAGVTLGDRPFRNAIIHAGTALQGGGSGSTRTTAGTEGSGTWAGSVAPSTAAASGGQSATGSAPQKSNAVKSHSAAAKCRPSVLPSVASTQPSLTDVQPSAPATSTATEAPAQAAAAPALSAQPVYTDTSALTCPVAAPAQSPTPAPATSAPTPTSTPTPTGGYPTSGYPTGGDPASGNPTPTAAPSAPDHNWPSPSDPSSWSRPDRNPRDSRYAHPQRH